MSSFTGQLLVSMPQLLDQFFARSVVYICSHSQDDGAMGLIINKAVEGLTIEKLYAQLKIEPVMRVSRPQPVHFGGPVQTDRAFVLHSPDYDGEGTLRIGREFAMTATLDILRAIGKDDRPRQAILAIGCSGWGPGQLESEIQANGWLSVAADTDLVFNSDDDSKWQRALAKLGVSPELLSSDIGHA
jgi:putative transcriptional regulator